MIKLSTAFKNWPHNTVACTRWFEHMGIHRDLLTSYKRSGWINSVGHGAYTRSDDTDLDWTGVVYTLQQHYGYHLCPGSRTVLEMHGLAHYVRLGSNTVYLITPNKAKNFLPSWVHHFENGFKFQLVQMSLFNDNFSDFEEYKPSGNNFTIRTSSKEQALLEMLSFTPNHMDIDEAYKVFENVGHLDTAKMSLLLRKCSSVKAKRLFMVMAKLIGRSWVNKLDISEVDFGTGQRNLIPGGKYDSEYQITVPKEWYDDGYPQL